MLDMKDRPIPRASMDPAIVGVMSRVGMWLAWLVANFLAASTLYNVKASTAGGFDFTQEGLYFLVMMLVVGWLAVKKDARVLETTSLVLMTVVLILVW